MTAILGHRALRAPGQKTMVRRRAAMERPSGAKQVFYFWLQRTVDLLPCRRTLGLLAGCSAAWTASLLFSDFYFSSSNMVSNCRGIEPKKN